ncbi:MAG: glycosyltransferase family 2 protein [Acidobacteria bacterium]|nr:glycosyltransferase family 2 protein [Acidobacteriota bacterium]
MSDPIVTVVVPTLHAGEPLCACLDALGRQTFADFETVVVDNSGRGLARPVCEDRLHVTLIENAANAGFGEAVNQGLRRSRAPFLATLNDDAAADPGWLAALVRAAESDPGAGMFASRVMLAGTGLLDSAGMLVSADASSKQRGHGQPPELFARLEETLFPSGSAALYRRSMLDEIGAFDPHFFLYCEDTDLGLRARWAGWTCLYVPGAVAEHLYSRSAGRASPLKAYLVERNRLFVLVKDYPLSLLLAAPLATLARYFWHAVWMLRGRGAAARFQEDGNAPASLLWYAVRAHCAALACLPRLWLQRRRIRRTARLSAAEFRRLVWRYFIGPREVAAL